MQPDTRVARVAAGHHGVFDRSTARAAGLSDRQVRHRVHTGRWDELRPGVYRIAGHPTSPGQGLAAAVLGSGAVASHRSAAGLLGLVEHPPARHELTADLDAAHRHVGLRIHRCADLLPADVATVGGIRSTNAVRTVIDLGARLSAAQLRLVVDRALHRRLVHMDRLTQRFLQLARPGRDGIATIRRVLIDLDPDLGIPESDLESRMVVLVAEAGLPTPIRQLPVRVAGRSFRLDLAYPDQMLAIECDGFAHHGSRRAFESDRERQNLLVAAGWTVLRFTWRQVCQRPADVVDVLRGALAAADLRDRPPILGHR